MAANFNSSLLELCLAQWAPGKDKVSAKRVILLLIMTIKNKHWVKIQQTKKRPPQNIVKNVIPICYVWCHHSRVRWVNYENWILDIWTWGRVGIMGIVGIGVGGRLARKKCNGWRIVAALALCHPSLLHISCSPTRTWGRNKHRDQCWVEKPGGEKIPEEHGRVGPLPLAWDEDATGKRGQQ